jgi:signal transduction histidine kinase
MLRFSWRELASPLALASYFAWAGVYVATTGLFGLPGDGLGWPAQLMLIGFLLAWLLTLALDEASARVFKLLCLLGLLVFAFGLLWLGRSNAGPILLVLTATIVVSVFPGRGAIPGLLAINLIFAAIMLWRWGWPLNLVLTILASYGAFQAFAALTIHYARRAEMAAAELRAVNAHLLATRSLLSETARDQERLRVSRELHDVAGHKLTALKLNLRNLARRPELVDCAELRQSSSLADELLEDMRAVVRQLRRDDGIDLAGGIRELIRPLPSPAVELDIEDGFRVPRADQAEALLRVAQEGLTNAARHGRARQAWMRLQRDDQRLHLTLDDDGQLTWPLQPGNGLAFMRERLTELGGELQLQRSDRGGLSLSASLPLEPIG